MKTRKGGREKEEEVESETSFMVTKTGVEEQILGEGMSAPCQTDVVGVADEPPTSQPMNE